ncbi:ABC transporter permease [Actinophytocola sp.]|uniref:ABC transporter permease n=1 Tax=Actinophytocola sp. TaxID=1872138 RepID=UPI003D6BD7A6
MALIGPLLLSNDPNATAPVNRLMPPGGEHLLGTDALGRDILSRLVAGSRVSLFVGLMVTLCSLGIGVTLGVLSGYYRRFGAVAMRITDGLMAFPAILFAIALVAIFGQGEWQMVLALTVILAPLFIRTSFGETRALRELDLIAAARVVGCSDLRVMFVHILPNLVPSLLVQGSFVFATAVLSEASLSFVGVGVPPPTASWGSMISDGRIFIYNAWWLIWPAAVALTSLVLSLSLLGDEMRDSLLRGKRDAEGA